MTEQVALCNIVEQLRSVREALRELAQRCSIAVHRINFVLNTSTLFDRDLGILIDRVFNRLRRLDEEFVSRGFKPLVLFSGGKDSLVVLDLCYKYFGCDMYVAYVHVNGNTHEDCDYYVVCTVERLLGSTRRFYYLYRVEPVQARGCVIHEPDFMQLSMLWGLPGIIHRWCMRVFKIEVLKHTHS